MNATHFEQVIEAMYAVAMRDVKRGEPQCLRALERLVPEVRRVMGEGGDHSPGAGKMIEAQAQGGGDAAGIEAAARFVDQRREAYDDECGCTDPETGTREYPGTGDEYVGELLEISEGIRALASPPRAAVGTLWCLHIIGPDDVIPAPSRAHAERAAQKHNEWYARQPKDDHSPKMEAVAAPWPHDAKSHAEGVDTFIERWLLPSWQVQAAARSLTQLPAPSAPGRVEAVGNVLQKLRRLALVIRAHGACAPLALDHIGDDLERAVAQLPAAVDECAERCKRRHLHTTLTLTRDAAPDTGWHWSVTFPDGHLYDVSQGRMSFEQARADLVERGLTAFDAADTAWRLSAQPQGERADG